MLINRQRGPRPCLGPLAMDLNSPSQSNRHSLGQQCQTNTFPTPVGGVLGHLRGFTYVHGRLAHEASSPHGLDERP